jgi:ketosteroid isomerase-like protein
MTDPDQVLEANLKFYFALESLDLDLMEEVWATDGSACCIHPSGYRLTGWESIRSNWEQIFRNTTFMRVDVSGVSVEFHGSVAWVNCFENITTSAGNQLQRARACATNVFIFEDDRWLLALHHASIISAE